jgi:hypothetical protein
MTLASSDMVFPCGHHRANGQECGNDQGRGLVLDVLVGERLLHGDPLSV